MKYFDSEKVIIKSWCNNPEDGCIEQAKNLANLPFIFKQVCLMPDTHQGYGMPIGGVIACENVVIPNAVGVDIGCGMLAVRTSLEEIDTEILKKIMGTIRETIPVGFNKHKKPGPPGWMPKADILNGGICNNQHEAARKQLGTLGGGNHFIEIQKGSDGFIWFMIHSGSRNLGYRVAKHYNDMAIKLNEKWFSEVPKAHELAFLPISEAGDYLKEMNYCLEFAKENRNIMALWIMDAFAEHLGKVEFDNEINIHHNYAAIENHFGKNVWVHRKGATSAREGQLGIIPGSQGTSSYIVKGKGNKDSFQSCSHGAGRQMGRKQAQRELNLIKERKKLEGIIHSVRSEKDLDESPGAYKDIDIVMKEQSDLVDIVVKLEPLGVIKG